MRSWWPTSRCEESELTVEDLAEHCLEHLARYKQPVAIELVDALPKNPVDKPTIRKRDGEARLREVCDIIHAVVFGAGDPVAHIVRKGSHLGVTTP